MKKADLNARLRNIARGRQRYRAHRQRVFNEIFSSPSERVEPFSSFLAKEFFSIDNGIWTVIAFNDRDWKFIERLRVGSEKVACENFVRLNIDYIKTNAKRVQEMYEFEARISTLILESRFDEALSAFNELDENNSQSIYAFRLFCALNSHSDKELIDRFRGVKYSDWLRIRFLYPLVYYHINLPSDRFFDFHLSHMMPAGHENDTERATIRYLLRDDLYSGENIYFKSYISLISHPFDAAEFMINHLELSYAKHGSLSPIERELMHALRESAPSGRLAALADVAGGEPLNFLQTGSDEALSKIIPGSEATGFSLAQFSSLAPLKEPPSSDTPVLKALFANRTPRYPTSEDFELSTVAGQRYQFTTAGKLILSLMNAFYLLPRRQEEMESRECLRLACFSGGVTPLVAASPRGRWALTSGRLRVSEHEQVAVEQKVSEALSSPSAYADRTWIVSTHWQLSLLQRQGPFSSWLDAVRSNIPIAPAYLTGIDWAWIRQVLDIQKIRPFYGSADGAYTLLLEIIEEQRRDSIALRTALSPITQKCNNVSDFVTWLANEYGGNAKAFIRYFLTADIILWLELSTNYTSALSDRMDALKGVVKQFGFDSFILSEETFNQEQRSYITSLLLINLTSNKFLISWPTLSQDAYAKHADLFKTLVAFSRQNETILSDVRNSTPYAFANGVVASYGIRNRDWPLCNVIFAFIDTFMVHPAHGIESILAVRIRHNDFRREFSIMFDDFRRGHWRDATVSDRNHVLGKIQEPYLAIVQNWIDRYLHQRRSEKDKALFDFVPRPLDLGLIVNSLPNPFTFDDIAAAVIDFIKSRLSSQLSDARDKLRSELIPELASEIERSMAAVSEEGFDERKATVIGQALKSRTTQTINEISEWFVLTSSNGDGEMTSLQDLSAAIVSRFEREIESERIAISLPEAFNDLNLTRDEARLVYDLWSELVHNALKHCGRPMAHVRIRTILRDGFTSLYLASASGGDTPAEEAFEAHPYESTRDEVFRDNNSGMRKVAALAASVAGERVTVRVTRRKSGYHAFVPLRRVLP